MEYFPLDDPRTLKLDPLVQRFNTGVGFYQNDEYIVIPHSTGYSTFILPAGIPIITPYLFVPFKIDSTCKTFRLQLKDDTLDISRYVDLRQWISAKTSTTSVFLNLTNTINQRRVLYSDLSIVASDISYLSSVLIH
jgi:hypothetical protein